MEVTIIIDNNNNQAQAVLNLLKTFSFVKIKETKLEEDENGIPIKYKNEISELSKEINANITRKWLDKKGIAI